MLETEPLEKILFTRQIKDAIRLAWSLK